MKYKYIIYKVYSWTANKRGDTPIANTILTLAVVHFFQLLTLVYFIDRIIIRIPWFWKVPKQVIYFGFPLYMGLLYLLLYNNKRWAGYVEEFGGESEQQRKRGTRLVLAYLVGSILLFFISLPLFSAISRYMGK